VLRAVGDAETRTRLRAAGLARAAEWTWERAAGEADALVDQLLSPESARRR
jgi:hypothetical protein